MRTFNEAREIVNGLINNALKTGTVKSVFGYLPTVFWAGAGYNGLPTDRVSIVVGHNQLQESKEKFIGGRNVWNIFGVSIEFRCPTSVLDGMNKVNELVYLFQKVLCANSDNGVDLRGCRLSFEGVEDGCYLVIMTIRYEFFTRFNE